MAKTYRMFPGLTLEEAVSKLNLVYDRVGKGPSSKESYIQGLGYKGVSGASSRVFAALTHYGFLEKSASDYKISELGMHTVLPDDESDSSRISYLRRAAINPGLFRDIYNRYVGERLPTMLHNTLVHDFRVFDKSGKEAADNFRKSLEYAGLISEGVVLSVEEVENVEQLQAGSRHLKTDASANDATGAVNERIPSTPGSDVKTLPSGISISFPAVFDFAVLTGSFGNEIKALEDKAQSILNKTKGTHENGGSSEA